MTMTTIATEIENDRIGIRATITQQVTALRCRRGFSGWKRTQTEAPLAISVRNLSKRYGTFQAVDDVSFDVPAGQLVALLGPSGSGKSTILRIIAGLETAEAGSVELTGEDATAVPIQRRGVGFVFQHYALFRHMTVRDNIAFGLKVRKLASAEIRNRVDELLGLVQLTGYASRYPSQLSGGQRQRVALARALAPRPKVLLLDEPFGALDAKVRDELRTWLRRLHDEVHVTSLFVTHDQQEAFEVADQVVVLNRGRIEQMGPPQQLYEQPATPFVTGFLGAVNVLTGQSAGGLAVLGEGVHVPAEWGDTDGPVSVYVRPHDLELTHERNGRPSWPGRIVRVTPLGAFMRLDVALADGTDVRVELSRDRFVALEPRIGETVFVTPRDLKVFLDPAQQPKPAVSETRHS
jgi:sulfate/thiosulfate transport system ATP-binding protein